MKKILITLSALTLATTIASLNSALTATSQKRNIKGFSPFMYYF